MVTFVRWGPKLVNRRTLDIDLSWLYVVLDLKVETDISLRIFLHLAQHARLFAMHVTLAFGWAR